MVVSAEPLAVYRIAEDMRRCVHERLSNTPGGEPDRSCVIAGAIAWDDCECGQLTVAIEQTYLSSSFPLEGQSPPARPGLKGCGAPIHVTRYRVSILRCAPSGRDDPDPPECAALDEAAQVTVYDDWATRLGLDCCLKEWARTRDDTGGTIIHDYVYGTGEYVGPAGMCQGFELPVFVAIRNACPPCEDAS